MAQSPGLSPEPFATRDQAVPSSPSDKAHWTLNLDLFFDEFPILEDLRNMLRILRESYGCHVDIEFTANVRRSGGYRINVLQCRPLQMQFSEEADVIGGASPDPGSVVLAAHGAVLGCSRALPIDRLIYVSAKTYGTLIPRHRYTVARLIGRLTKIKASQDQPAIMLIGPGRWGTKMPELGVPVAFADINTVSVLCEIEAMHEGLIPDLSLATHFFHELVEMNMLYLGYFQKRPENRLNLDFLEQAPNHLAELLPDEADWGHVVRVLQAPAGQRLRLEAHHMQQKSVLYLTDR